MAQITLFALVPNSITATTAQFTWTLNLDGNSPVSGTYKLMMGALNQAARYDVTFAKQPYTFPGLQAGQSYTIFLQLTLNGVQQGGEATVPITTPKSGGGGGGATPEYLIGNYAVKQVGTGSVILDWILNPGQGSSHATDFAFSISNGKGKTVTVSPLSHPYTFEGLESNTTYAFTSVLTYASINFHQSQTLGAATTGFNGLSAIALATSVGSISNNFVHAYAIDTKQTIQSIVRQGPQSGDSVPQPWVGATPLKGTFYKPTQVAVARSSIMGADNFTYDNVSVASIGTDKAAYTYNNVGLVGLGGSFIKPLVAAGLAGDEVYLLGVGSTDGLIYLKKRNDNQTWDANWTEFNLKNAAGGPYDFDAISSAISVNANQVDIVIPVCASNRSGGTQTTLLATLSGSGWSVFDLDLQSYADMTLTSCAPGRLDVLALNTNGDLCHRSRIGSTWAAWENVGHTNSSWAKPAAASWGTNRIDVVVVGSDSSFYRKWYDGKSWNPPDPNTWDPIGGKLNTPVAPALAAPATNWLEVFVKGTDSGWYSNSWNGSKWEGWVSHSVTLA